jgi:hypothetical protein
VPVTAKMVYTVAGQVAGLLRVSGRLSWYVRRGVSSIGRRSDHVADSRRALFSEPPYCSFRGKPPGWTCRSA